MARRIGSAAGESLFGTGKGDLILGMGGQDTLKGNGGNDTIAGFGEIFGDRGNDRFSAVGVDRSEQGDLAYTLPDMGPGRDTVVVNAHDDWRDDTFIMYGIGQLGAGRDTFVLASSMQGTVALREGPDRAFVLSQGADSGFEIRASDLGFGTLPDAGRDVISWDGYGSFTIDTFGENDVLKIFGTGLDVADIRDRTVFDNDFARTNLRILLDDGAEVRITKPWEGYLTEDNLATPDRNLRITRKVVIEDDTEPTKVMFASGADERIVARGKALFLGDGNDRGIGQGRNDHMRGERGNDTLIGNDGADTLRGGYGDDALFGGKERDDIDTGGGDDLVNAGRGADTIRVGAGAVTLIGGAGPDTFMFDSRHVGDLTTDVLQWTPALVTGGPGRDTFVFSEPSTAGALVIENFAARRELLDMRGLLPGFEDPEQKARKIDDVLKSVADVTPETDYFSYTAYLGITGTQIIADGVVIYLEGVSADRIDEDNFLF